MQNVNQIIIYIDGGSRGNPGPAALGVVFADEKNRLIKAYSQAIGKATNNEAEYAALIFALKKIKALLGKSKVLSAQVIVNSDSELLVKQMQGKYKIKEPAIQQLFLRAWNLKVEFKNLNFNLIPREQNRAADKLVNNALDAAKIVDKSRLF